MSIESKVIKLKKMGRPEVDSEQITLRIPRDLLDALDTWRRSQSDLPARTEAIRRALSDWLREKGYLK